MRWFGEWDGWGKGLVGEEWNGGGMGWWRGMVWLGNEMVGRMG